MGFFLHSNFLAFRPAVDIEEVGSIPCMSARGSIKNKQTKKP